MAMGTERSQPLHNFTLPDGLRWGNQRFLRCMKVEDSDGKISPENDSDSSDQHHNRRRQQNSIQQRKLTAKDRDSSPAELIANGSDKIDDIASVREKVMFDLQSASDKMKEEIFKEKGKVSVAVSPQPPPWNLRTRRASIKTLAIGGGGSAVSPAAINDSIRFRSGGEKKDRAKFSLSLSKREIEEDFLSIAGHRPHRRPRKRTKTLQKQLDAFFPGLWLTEVTLEMYKVHEPAP